MKMKATDLPPARAQLKGLLHGADMGEMQGAYLPSRPEPISARCRRG
ncbi:hypothetical protein ROJ8625_02799 [Roseivivax jejudonensis]|uniref:Uncharacterized protein n=1 Tax=Roseivivax jejudonensis TaxID=1529041 RepID=A0A1X6ZMP1_9RHOB|nr:hypothetical protein [Roseivivax jejudonensis]SLN55792.1 hypothetical protein ROJ8625_02799 [Roseivivax jejudonensis]